MAGRPSRDVTLKAADLDQLYAARGAFGQGVSERLDLRVPIDIYLQDPLVARQDPGLAFDGEHFVEWEPGLGDGPTSARFAVVDFDADTGRLVPPARCDHPGRNFKGEGGVELSRERAEDPQFHQVLIWAVLQRALEFFEHPNGLGRSLPWGFEGNRLIVVPHAGCGENAYYDRQSKSLQFYYFGDETTKPGKGRVDTCLSTDIVHHEFAHAALDGVRPLLIESLSLETAAFHEAMGDITAVLLALRNNTLRKKLAEQTGGDMAAAEALAAIAEEFGRGVADKPYLRSALNQDTMDSVAHSHSPHRVSQVLTGAVFDILIALSQKYAERGRTPAEAFWHAAARMQRMAIQPLDLLPPVDVTFRDYALAMLRAEQLANPLDPRGYRSLMLEVFEARRILDAEECGKLAEKKYLHSRPRLDIFHPVERIAASSSSAYRFLDDNRKALKLPRNRDLIVAGLYTAEKWGRQAARLPRQVVLQYAWRERVPLEDRRFDGAAGHSASLLFGGTLVFDDRGNLQAWSRKHGGDADPGRQQRCLDRLARRLQAGHVGELHQSPVGLLGSRAPLLACRQVDGSLRFELTPHLHISEHEGEGRCEISC